MNTTKIAHHIDQLQSKHWHVNKQIELMERHGKYTDAEMQYLKKERLHLKDEIEKMKAKIVDEEGFKKYIEEHK